MNSINSTAIYQLLKYPIQHILHTSKTASKQIQKIELLSALEGGLDRNLEVQHRQGKTQWYLNLIQMRYKECKSTRVYLLD